MKRGCLIILCMLFIFSVCNASDSVLTPDLTAIAFLNSAENDTGSYRIGFSSKPISYLTDSPEELKVGDLAITVKPGDYKGTNENIYLFFQIISTQENLKLTLDLSIGDLTNGTDTIDWRIHWNAIEGLVDGGTVGTGSLSGNGIQTSKEIITFERSSDRISVADSLLLYVETEDISNHLYAVGEYKGTVTLTISAEEVLAP